jgi:hypothetical protein
MLKNAAISAGVTLMVVTVFLEAATDPFNALRLAVACAAGFATGAAWQQVKLGNVFEEIRGLIAQLRNQVARAREHLHAR